MFLLRLIWAVVRALFAKRADLVVDKVRLAVSYVEGRKHLPVILCSIFRTRVKCEGQ